MEPGGLVSLCLIVRKIGNSINIKVAFPVEDNLAHDITSGSEITLYIKIDKPLVFFFIFITLCYNMHNNVVY